MEIEAVFGQVLAMYSGSEEGRLCVVVTLAEVHNLSQERANQLYWSDYETIAMMIKHELEENPVGFINLLNLCTTTLNQLFNGQTLIEE